MAPSSALLCGGMLTTTVNFPARRAPSPQIRARDTSLDSAANASARINSTPNVDAGFNAATHLGGHRCGDHEDDGDDSTNDRKLASIIKAPHSIRVPLAGGASLIPLVDVIVSLHAASGSSGSFFRTARKSEQSIVVSPVIARDAA